MIDLFSKNIMVETVSQFERKTQLNFKIQKQFPPTNPIYMLRLVAYLAVSCMLLNKNWNLTLRKSCTDLEY